MQGIAVHIAARIAGEIRVSRTAKDLVAGSGLRFNDRGRHLLKGLQDAMELYAASSGNTTRIGQRGLRNLFLARRRSPAMSALMSAVRGTADSLCEAPGDRQGVESASLLR